jgi:8-oxo-dGTP pyrophosphatase MutT (NUDIX family)
MTEAATPRWLAWAREIQALAQSGLTYADNEYERIRYRRLREIAAEIVEAHTELAAGAVLESLSLQPGYATPKVDVRGAVVRQGQILLVQERADGRWCMPGGWADVGDRPSEVAAREIWEESGYVAVPRKVIGIYDANRSGRPLEFYHAYKVVFLCELTGGEATSSHETVAVGWFDLDDPPPLSANRTNERHLAEIAAHLRDPERPAAFD